jgi:4-methyl-5(b-hydroxyethyl)-thiazole monophosphate biosynthesis
MANILIPLANGVEEMEAVIITDTLRRAKLNVVMVSISDSLMVTGSRGVMLQADDVWGNHKFDSTDAILIPGGAPGAAALSEFVPLLEQLQVFDRTGKLIGAICAGPLVLQSAGILENRKVTCHPAVAQALTMPHHVNDRVVEDRNLITSQAPGTAFEFALAVITRIEGSESWAAVGAGLILTWSSY